MKKRIVSFICFILIIASVLPSCAPAITEVVTDTESSQNTDEADPGEEELSPEDI